MTTIGTPRVALRNRPTLQIAEGFEMGKPRGRTRPAVRLAQVKMAATSSEVRSRPPLIPRVSTYITLMGSSALAEGTRISAMKILPLRTIACG